MTISLKINPQLLSTAIPNFFIDNFMAKAKPIFSIVYIYIYKQCASGNKKINIIDVAEEFNISETDVTDSLNYWHTKKLILYNKIEPNVSIEFLVPEANQTDIDESDDNLSCVQRDLENTGEETSLKEINLYENDPNISELFDFAQEILGRYLSYSELNTLFMFYNSLKMPMDLIKFLLSYCVDNGHKSLAYIKKVAFSWSEQKINSVEEAQDKILDLNDFFGDIKKSLAVDNLNKRQRDFFSDWQRKLSGSSDLIIEACNITMMSIGRPNYRYINSILENWQKNNIKTIEQTKSFGLKNKNVLVDFEQRVLDFEKIEQIAQSDAN